MGRLITGIIVIAFLVLIILGSYSLLQKGQRAMDELYNGKHYAQIEEVENEGERQEEQQGERNDNQRGSATE